MTLCWRCCDELAPDEVVALDGVLVCRECAAIETGDDGRPDRVRDL